MRRLLPAVLVWLLLTVAPAYATFTATCGSGGTYADLNACVTAAIAAGTSGGTQTENFVFQITAAGIKSTTTQTIGGYTASTFTTTVQPAAAAGWVDTLNISANRGLAAHFNSTYGAFIYSTTNLSSGLINISTNNVTITGMQIYSGDQNTDTILTTSSAAASITLTNNIIYGAGTTHSAPVIFDNAVTNTHNLTMTDNLIVGLDTIDTMAVSTGGAVTACYNTLAMPLSTLDQGAGMNVQTSVGSTTTLISDNAIIGFGQGVGGESNAYDAQTTGTGASGTHNATHRASFIAAPFATAAVLNSSSVSSFLNANLTTPGLWDFRIPSGSALKGAATSAACGVTTDALGRTRNSPDDIGFLAYQSNYTPVTTAGVKTGFVYFGDTLPDGTSGWSVPADWDSSHNLRFAIAAGAGGQTTIGSFPGGSGGGEYCAVPNGTYTPGQILSFVLNGPTAANASAPNTSWGSDIIAVGGTKGAGGGGTGVGGTGGTGTTCHDGGAGPGNNSNIWGAGGAAGGPNGAGGAGGPVVGGGGPPGQALAGGGGADGGAVGHSAPPVGTGVGGTAQDGTLGGAVGTSGSINGSAGSHGSGGGGGYAPASGQGGNGGNGGAGVSFTANTGAHNGDIGGPGGGGGEGGWNNSNAGTGIGGVGGAYGGGAGGNGSSGGTVVGATGGADLLVYQYGQSITPTGGSLPLFHFP